MPIIVKPRTLLLYLMNELERRGPSPTSVGLVGFCSELQASGSHIYSCSSDPNDPHLQRSVAQDIQDCQINGWVELREGSLSVSERGKNYLRGMAPSSELGAKVDALLQKYDSERHS